MVRFQGYYIDNIMIYEVYSTELFGYVWGKYIKLVSRFPRGFRSQNLKKENDDNRTHKKLSPVMSSY